MPASSVSHARRLLRWGVLVSSVYLTALGVYAWNVSSLMMALTPDEFATFLSGVFAPLGFLWLVLGFRQQGDELQNSARALWLQGEELRNSVEQQRQLVEVSREQLASELEARQRQEDDAERAAQPQLVAPSGGGSYSGPRREIRFSVHSGGPTCSDAVILIDDMVIRRTSVLAIGEKIQFSKNYDTPDQVEPFEFLVQYTDLRGNRRQQKFFVPVDEYGGPNKDRTLGIPKRVGGVEEIVHAKAQT